VTKSGMDHGRLVILVGRLWTESQEAVVEEILLRVQSR
jgi:hypothetical protein